MEIVTTNKSISVMPSLKHSHLLVIVCPGLPDKIYFKPYYLCLLITAM